MVQRGEDDEESKPFAVERVVEKGPVIRQDPLESDGTGGSPRVRHVDVVYGVVRVLVFVEEQVLHEVAPRGKFDCVLFGWSGAHLEESQLLLIRVDQVEVGHRGIVNFGSEDGVWKKHI